MPQADPEAIHDLSHFAGVLQALGNAGFAYAVIGGAAISAYARSLAAEITTRDLDLFVTQSEQTLEISDDLKPSSMRSINVR